LPRGTAICTGRSMGSADGWRCQRCDRLIWGADGVGHLIERARVTPGHIGERERAILCVECAQSLEEFLRGPTTNTTRGEHEQAGG
jgi:hypothetical protein